MNSVWIVDDDQSIRWVLERALTREGFEVRAFESAPECLRALEGAKPRVLVSDIRMPGDSGIDLLRKVRDTLPGLPVIIMTAYSDLESAVSAFQGGAFDYLPKPFDLPKAVELIRRAMQESGPLASSEEELDPNLEILGKAPAMQEVFRAIGRLSHSGVTVLITGESGTGKELVARALHDHSPRAGQAFVALNTAAIPRDLLESELFGHERGAFTGAQQLRRGRFEQAEGGTLFLDEIGDMPADLQTRLLRVLADGQFYRVGGHQPLRANVRVIAATHQDLEDRVRQGQFREDLFHRLNVIRLRLPPLRERTEDIGLLSRHFLLRSARELGGEPKRLTEDALVALAKFRWPGNVRQLENVCHWLTVMAPAQSVRVKDLPPEIREAAGDHASVLGAVHGDGARAEAAGEVERRGFEETGSERTSGQVGWQGGVSAGELAAGGAVGVGADGAPGVGSTASVAGLIRAAGEAPSNWLQLLEREVAERLSAPQPRPAGPSSGAQTGRTGGRDGDEGGADPGDDGAAAATDGLMDQLVREFESVVIRAALRHTRGRRIEAAQRLGIGRNTITRKIQELKLED